MATYQLLSHHHNNSHINLGQNQRQALSFTILILLVAIATLLTIIRFTINPNIVDDHYLYQPKALFFRPLSIGNDSLSSQIGKFKSIEKDDSKQNNNKINHLPDLKQSFPSSNKQQQKPRKEMDIHSQAQQQQQETLSKSFTSLIADQRFEKDYRDDPVTMRTNIAHNQPKRPKIIFDQNDLAYTTLMRIDKKEPCGESNGSYADLLVLVNSAVSNFDARSAIRDTWGRFAIERGAYLYFLLGSTEDDRIQAKVEAEDAQYSDILQASFIDNYYNLTLKTITMMYWVSTRCSKIRYTLKVDDDMMMNMQHACDFAEINPNFHRVIIGKLAKQWKPHRSRMNKWYVPPEAYNQTYFPNFVTGPAYFFTGDAAQPLYEAAVDLNRTTPFYLEDVFMTGIVAELARIRRFNHALMKNVHLKVNVCTFPRFMTSHKYFPAQIRFLWNKIYYTNQKCVIAKKSLPSSNNNNQTTPKVKVAPKTVV